MFLFQIRVYVNGKFIKTEEVNSALFELVIFHLNDRQKMKLNKI